MGPGIKRLGEIGKEKEAILKSEQNLEHRQQLIRSVHYVVIALHLSSAVFSLRAVLNA